MSPDERLARWTAPLATPSPDPRQHPSFDAIRSETAKLESPAGGPPDWAEVARAGDAFLGEIGRDLIVGAALASALAHREGVAGMALGARLLGRLLADPSTTPPRPRARANAIGLFVSRAEVALETAKDRQRPTYEALDRALADLDASGALLGDDAPTLAPLRDRVRRALEAMPVPAPAAPPAPPPVAAAVAEAPVFVLPPPPLPAAHAPVEPTIPDRPEQVPAFVRRTAALLTPAAALVRHAAPLDGDALRLTLVALYLPITCAPETTRGARTALSAPPKLVLETLAKQAATAAPELVVRDALAAIERSRFALDLHTHLARGLERAGASAALAVHRHEVRGLLDRLPELLDREFSDGTPFASPETRAQWAASAPAPAAATAEADDPFAEARALAARGNTAAALALGTRLRAATTGRARFEATLTLGSIAEEARAWPLANELYASLVDDVDRHGLEAWDPTSAARALRARARALAATPGHDAAAKLAWARLARLDPAAALEISSREPATPVVTRR